MTLAATREPMAVIPRPASAPINPCENGLLGRPCIMLGGATLVAGRDGIARSIPGAPVCQPVRYRQPARMHRAGHLRLDAGLNAGSPLRQLAAHATHQLSALAVDHLADVVQQRCFHAGQRVHAGARAALLPPLMNIRAGVLPSMPM